MNEIIEILKTWFCLFISGTLILLAVSMFDKSLLGWLFSSIMIGSGLFIAISRMFCMDIIHKELDEKKKGDKK